MLQASPFFYSDGDTYEIIVRAQDSQGYADSLSTIAFIVGRPRQPREFWSSLEDNSEKQISLKWLSPEGNEGAKINFYRLYMRPKGQEIYDQVRIYSNAQVIDNVWLKRQNIRWTVQELQWY
jgi:hypothetical protein